MKKSRSEGLNFSSHNSSLDYFRTLTSVHYIPSISNAFGYNSFYWRGDDSDEKYYNFGIICKSKEEAIALRQKMLAVAKKKNE